MWANRIRCSACGWVSDQFLLLVGTPKSVAPQEKGPKWGSVLTLGLPKSIWGDYLKKYECWYVMANGAGQLQRSEVNSAWPQGHSEQNVPRTKHWWGCKQHRWSATAGRSIRARATLETIWPYLTEVACAFLWPSNSPERHIFAPVHPEMQTRISKAALLAMAKDR